MSYSKGLSKGSSYEELIDAYGKRKVDLEIELENEAQDLGRREFLKKLQNYRELNQGANHGTAKSFMEVSFPKVKQAIIEFFNEANTGKAGRKHRAYSLLKDIDVDILAYLSLRTTINTFLSMPFQVGLNLIAKAIADIIEDEVRFQKVVDTMSVTKKQRFQENLNKRISFDVKRTYIRAIERQMLEEGDLETVEVQWSNADKIHVGTKLYELVCVSTGFCKVKLAYTSHNGKFTVADRALVAEPSSDIMNFIQQGDESLAQGCCKWLPMVIPPKPWDSVYDGGYYLEVKRPVRFVRTRFKTLKDVYEDADLTNAFKAVNAIQSTPWRINTEVLDVAKEILSWKHIPEALDMPTREASEPPMRPPEADFYEEAHTLWKKNCVRYYQQDNRRKSRRLRLEAILGLADKYKNESDIYFPHNVDFRGRVYPVTILNPQGDDFMKSLLEFADGVELGEHGATWLAFHGANCYGLDKATIEERLAWVYTHEDLILSVANDPLNDLSWTSTDSPWMFLAFCFEWKKYLLEGKSFKSHLPVAFDGSCSGIQHFSAMLRDSVGGKAVNLVPQDKVADIYKMVAEKVEELCKKDLKEGTEDGDAEWVNPNTGEIRKYVKYGTKSLASDWLNYGITRKVTKRSVMTLAYGSKEYGFSEQVYEDTIVPAMDKNPNTFKSPVQASKYMAKLIWVAVQSVVVKAVEAMEWLQDLAGLLAKEKDMYGNALPVIWSSPCGFPVRQSYEKDNYSRLKTVLNGSIYLRDGNNPVGDKCTVFMTYKNNVHSKLDPRKQRNGIAPNFVHSMDASHLMLTVLKCTEKGLNSFQMIHDSFGTHAGNADVMYKTIREVFVDTYTKHNVLQELKETISVQLKPSSAEKIKPIPEFGDLNLEEVKDSLYAFA